MEHEPATNLIMTLENGTERWRNLKAQKSNIPDFEKNALWYITIFVLNEKSDEQSTCFIKTYDDLMDHWGNLETQKNNK